MSHFPFEVTAEQRSNLETLASFLERSVPPPTFSMKTFVTVKKDFVLEEEFDEDRYFDSRDALNSRPSLMKLSYYTEPDCGTVACAVGHGPLAGIAPLEDESWFEYSKRVFGAPYGSLFRWLFDDNWANVDDTATGAAARIRYYLEHGIPENYYDQHFGRAPLCYTVAGTVVPV